MVIIRDKKNEEEEEIHDEDNNKDGKKNGKGEEIENKDNYNDNTCEKDCQRRGKYMIKKITITCWKRKKEKLLIKENNKDTQRTMAKGDEEWDKR